MNSLKDLNGGKVMKLETPYERFRVWLLENLKELAQIKEYPDTKSNSAMKIAVMNAEAATILALMALETREDTMLACTKVAEDLFEGMKKMRGETKCDS